MTAVSVGLDRDSSTQCNGIARADVEADSDVIRCRRDDDADDTDCIAAPRPSRFAAR